MMHKQEQFYSLMLKGFFLGQLDNLPGSYMGQILREKLCLHEN